MNNGEMSDNAQLEEKKKRINDILERASLEVAGWPFWMRSEENRREMDRIRREEDRDTAAPPSREAPCSPGR